MRETLESILAQTYSNLVIHISDNASTDGTLKVVESFQDSRIHIHPQKENIGGEGNFTRCIQLAEGEYTAIFHADDLYAPTIIEKEVKFLMQNKQACGVLTFATQIDSQGQCLKTFLAPGSLGLTLGESRTFGVEQLYKAILRHDNFLFCPSAMMRTSVCINQIRTWRGDLFKSSADLDIWFRLAHLGGVGLLNEPLLFYRISDMQWTASYRKKRRTQSDIFLVLDVWKKHKSIKRYLDAKDAIHYQKLRRYDMLGCMLNAVRNNEIKVARSIWFKDNIFSFMTELLQIRTVKDFKFFMLSNGKVLRSVCLVFLDKVRL